jgi:hypothetical protein
MFRVLRLCLVLAACSLAIPAAAAGDVPLDEDGFTAFVAKIVQKAQPDASVETVGPLHLRLKQNGEVWETHLFTIHSYCLRNPKACEASVMLHVQQLAEAHKPGVVRVEASALRVVVRQSKYVEQAEAVLRGRGEPIVEPLVGDLWTIAVLDMPTAVQVLKPKDLETLHLSADEALARAKENTKAAIARRVPGKASASSNISVLPGDTYQASLLAFPEIWAPLAATYDNRLIVSVPGTHMVLFTKNDASDSVSALAAIAEASMQSEERPLSASVYRWTPNGWVEARR